MTTIRVIAFTLLTSVAGVSHAAVLCQAKGERLVVRESCRKREHPVDPTVLAVPGPTGASGAPGTPGAAATLPLRLLDANGIEIGRILQFFPGGAMVEMGAPLLATPILVYVVPEGFAPDTGFLRYTSTDCSGVAFMRENYQDPSYVHPPLATVFGTAAYYATDARQPVTYHSTEYDPRGAACGTGSVATARNTCCTSQTGDATGVVRTARVLLDGLGLETPFRTAPR